MKTKNITVIEVQPNSLLEKLLHKASENKEDARKMLEELMIKSKK